MKAQLQVGLYSIGSILSFLPKAVFKKQYHYTLFRFLILFLIAIFPNLSNAQPNPISIENALPGNPSNEWDISGAGDLTIQGFATEISVNKKSTMPYARVDFKIKSPSAYTIEIYRLGWYGGNGARKVSSLTYPVVIDAPLPQTQPADNYDVATGKTSCENWALSAHWVIPPDAVSGLYIAKLTKTVGGGSSHIAFIVRDDEGAAPMLFKTADATWQAYNAYGGNSLYVEGIDVSGFNHATKVSYDRPFITRNGGGGGGASEDWLFNAEYPLIRWLERNGYHVSYTTDVDMDKDPKGITPTGTGGTTYAHKIILSVGHDEYWSAAQRTKFENARNAGVHLAFFSGNEVYWKTRWEDNHRTLVCYKEGTLGENVCGSKCDLTTPIWTGLWRDGNPATYSGSDGGKPENALTGQISWADATTSIVIPSEYKNLRFWRNTSIALLPDGLSATLPYGTLGYEWDFEQSAYSSNNPPGRITLSSTTAVGKTHKLSLYRHSSGALVFGAGTVQWSWGLDNKHDRGSLPASQDMQQATMNLFSDMDVLPATKQTELIANSPTDNTAPSSIITSPVEASSLPAEVSVNITGTASDAGGIVAGVEVSVDGGTTWKLATGTNNWTYSWIPELEGSATILSRAFDDNGNIETAGTAPDVNAKTVTITPAPPPVCPCSIWPTNPTPLIQNENDAAAVEVGVKFQSYEPGYITAIRFYKGSLNTGTHTGNLWNASGENLGSVTFSSETNDGWQVAYFANPVQINANTTYIASYHTTSGYYSADGGYFENAVIKNSLTALANSTTPNGVYKYGASGFPNQTYNATNYWVDVVFETLAGPDLTAPLISVVNPANSSTSININTTVNTIFNEPINPLTINSSTVELRNPLNEIVAATIFYNAGTRTATLQPTSSLAYSTTYTARVRGGVTDPSIKDVAGNSLAADFTWTFTTGAEPPPPPIEGLGGPILVISSTSNPFSRYTNEILRAEGINSFDSKDISQVSQTDYDDHDVIILGEISLTPAQVTSLTTWVNAGGTLIAFKPDPQLNELMGINAYSGTLSDKYLLVNTASGPGTGIVNQTIQFHGTANLHTLNGATALATLYSNATTATSNPAVTSINVGSNGGKAIAFTYDLARSIVYTRQGNPDWAGQSRDGQPGPIRSDNLFFPDYIDFTKIQIPQADEQQHLLSNIITQGSLHRKPLPKFWFLPRKLKAAVVMTGDDHANGGTIERFNRYKVLSGANNTPQDVLDWRAIRGSSYIYSSTSTGTITPTQASTFESEGFEIAAHISTNCVNWTSQSNLDNFYTTQLAEFAGKWPGVPAPTTNRTHCIAWSDWATQPKVELLKGIRLDANYYYWPGSWINNRAGMFTGSGMPMRFADLDGTLIDCYQVATQMPDESAIQWPGFINTLLDNAIGVNGYYGVFCANMHTDVNTPGDQSVVGSEAIVAAAIARQVPVISARQMLQWLDGRNGSNFNSMVWSGNTLSFTISNATNGEKLQAMVPVSSISGTLNSVTRSGAPVTYTTEVIKGINYAFFDATDGDYEANYIVDVLAPVISNVLVTPNTDGTALITWTTDELSDSRIEYGISEDNLNLSSSSAIQETSHSITITGLTAGTTYYFRIISKDASNNSTTEPVTSSAALSFAMPAGVCATDDVVADFNDGTTGVNTIVTTSGNGAVTLRPTFNEEFSGTSIPSGWQSFAWTGGTSTVSGGSVIVDGARLNTTPSTTTFGPGRSMEFVATFGTTPYQHIGFGGGTDAVTSGGIYAEVITPWAFFSTNNTTGSLFARTNTGSTLNDQLIAGSWIGSPHLYRIQWNLDGSFDYFIDGTLVHTSTVNITSNMRIAASDYFIGDPELSIEFIRMTPYVSSGSFISRVFDAGTLKTWQEVNWNADIPSGTSLQISQRQSNSSVDILSTPWTPISTNGAVIGGTSQYIQYKADLATTNTAITPELSDISFNCEEPAGNSVPVVTAQPATQTTCVGESVSFTSAASGVPVPTVQWQLSTDNGSIWTNISGATSPTYTFTAVIGDNGKQYRAEWTNTEGIINSNTATLTVNPPLTATLSAVKNPVCEDETISLQLTEATGQSPYTVVVNGITYNNVTLNTPFANFPQTALSIWGSTATPASPSVTDNRPIEVGTKFRSSVSGYITGIRFYKGLTNTGVHTAHLWTSSGALLASAIFTAETASGWQEVKFVSPVAILANTTYVASYFSAGGYFAITSDDFDSDGETNGPLTALRAGTDGPNGVFKYDVSGFPDVGNNDNYWVDVLFKETIDNSPEIYNLTSITDANNCTNTGAPLSTVTVTTSITGGTISASPSTVCAGEPINLTFTSPGGSGPYSLVINGTTYSGVTSGVPFSAGNATVVPTTIWSPATVGGSQVVDKANTELGVRISSTVSGTISGIRFYQTSTGTLFTGSLWAVGNTIAPLATASYTSDGTPGWKQVNFLTPVPITAGIDYIASYSSPAENYYAFTANGLSAPVVNAPLTAEASFFKQPGPGYPDLSSTANYWVDVVFNGPSGITNYNLTSITNGGCTATGSPISTASVTVNNIPPAAIINNTGTTVLNVTTPSISLTATGGGTFSWSNGVSVVGTNANLTVSSPGTYTVTVTGTSGCTNTASINITSEALSLNCATDNSALQLSLGNPGLNTIVVDESNGAIILKPNLNEEFSATSIPQGWEGAGYGDPLLGFSFMGGATVVENAHVYTHSASLFNPGTSIEFQANFTNGSYQNIGFSSSIGFGAPWLSIGRGLSVGNGEVYIRANFGTNSAPILLDIQLGNNLAGGSHRYKISWNANGTFNFYVDGVLINTPTVTQTISGTMGLEISDAAADGQTLSVDWIRVSPFASPGVFTSRVMDAGSTRNWDKVVWNSIEESGTSIIMKVRTGNTSLPDVSWTGFTPFSNGAALNMSSRYIQYEATLTSSNPLNTPVLQDVSFSCFAAFPVELVSLRGNAIGRDVKLDWRTASESNNRGFEVQRSNDGSNWQDVGFVPGAGNSVTFRNYSFLDKNLAGNKYFYRLKQIDFDGRFTNSNIISISLNTNNGYILDQNYPNPFNNSTMIGYSLPKATYVQISIYDLQGRVVQVVEDGMRPAGKHTLRVNTNNLSHGVYYYKMKAGDFTETKRMIMR